MSSLQEKKLQKLYHFCLENGLSCSTEEISKGLGITKRTIFNRYKTLDNLQGEVVRFWRLCFYEKYCEKSEFCNDEVELLLCFVYEMKLSYKNEPEFFAREKERRLFLSDQEGGFVEMISQILKKGIQNGIFAIKEEEITQVAKFLIFNVVHYFIQENKEGWVIEHLLTPLLTERGKKTIESIDLSNYFK